MIASKAINVRPARWASTANRCKAIRFAIRSATERCRFWRTSVRSTWRLQASIAESGSIFSALIETPSPRCLQCSRFHHSPSQRSARPSAAQRVQPHAALTERGMRDQQSAIVQDRPSGRRYRHRGNRRRQPEQTGRAAPCGRTSPPAIQAALRLPPWHSPRRSAGSGDVAPAKGNPSQGHQSPTRSCQEASTPRSRLTLRLGANSPRVVVGHLAELRLTAFMHAIA